MSDNVMPAYEWLRKHAEREKDEAEKVCILEIADVIEMNGKERGELLDKVECLKVQLDKAIESVGFLKQTIKGMEIEQKREKTRTDRIIRDICYQKGRADAYEQAVWYFTHGKTNDSNFVTDINDGSKKEGS